MAAGTTKRDELTGRTLGEFVLRERIGEGGFGAVYRCEQPLLGREAVVKVLHTQLRGHEILVQRFTREAQLASRLDHPYAAHIYAFGVEKEDGLCWLAMELVAGTPLHRWLRDRGPLSLAQLVPFFERVAEVVQTAHEAGIVHRDLKPANIMVIERAGRLLPKLLDFGIAKLVGVEATAPASRASVPVLDAGPPTIVLPESAHGATPTPTHAHPPPAAPTPTPTPTLAPAPTPAPTPTSHGAASSREIATLPVDPQAPWISTSRSSHSGSVDRAQLTQNDATMGSPPYMSPEQWRDATHVGPGSDLYALGVVAYEALLGRRPFSASTPEALAELHEKAPVPPVGDSLPPALDAFFARALAKRPEDRPASALELAASLRVAAGIGAAPEDLPRLDEATRDAWLAEAPQPLAEGVAELDGARNAHQARDAARDLLHGLVRYLLAIALASRAQVRGGADDPAVRELLRALRGRDLDEEERVKLLRLLVRPFVERRGAYPVPEMVGLVAPGGGDTLDALVELHTSAEHAGAEQAVRSHLARFIPALGRVMRACAFVLDYPLTVPAGRVPERWMGIRRTRRAISVIRGRDVTPDRPVLLASDGMPVLELWPLVQAMAPTAGADRELFVLDGRGRLGARLTASPAGYEHHDPSVWDWFGDHVLGEREGADPRAADDRPPYLGLASFGTGDADRFVGREREIDAFINRLRKAALQIVVGPSGAGKSSFVHAGIVPNLPDGWRVVTLRPGMTPLATLGSRLAGLGAAAASIPAAIATDPAAAAARVREVAGSATIVVVVDQLEELFTLDTSAAERDAFAAALAHLAASPDEPTRVICTVRDDFLMHVESLQPLRAALSPALFLIGNPSRDDLVRTVVEPARRAGYELSDPDLARDMVETVADRPGALALLSFTASRLWELRDRRFHQLTRKAYDAMGGVAGALGQHAEATFTQLVPDEQRVAREAFRYLVTSEMTRAVLTVDELRQRLASPRADAVIGKLVDARLLTIVEEGGAPQIEIVHEALIGAWPRLPQWAHEDAARAQDREQLRAAAKQWTERGRPRDLLWRGDLLAELQRWRSRMPLTDIETAFADASRADATRGLRIRRGLVAAALALAGVFVVVLARANGEAQHARRDAESLLRDSTFDQGRLRMLQGDKLGALPFLAKAYRMGEVGVANRLLIEEALRPTRARVRTLAGHSDKLWQVIYSPDGSLLATASSDGTARIWRADTGVEIGQLKLDGSVNTVAFSPDGKLLAAAGRDSAVRLWDVAAGRPGASYPVGERVYTVAFSSDGKQLIAAGAASGAIWTWTVGVPAPHTFTGFDSDASALPSTDGQRVTAWDIDGHVAFLDAGTLAPTRTVALGASTPVGGALPDGKRAVLADDDGTLYFVHDDGTVDRRVAAAPGPSSLAVSPDGSLVAVGTKTGATQLWSADGKPLSTLIGRHGRVDSVQFSPDGAQIAVGSVDGGIRLWSTATSTSLGELVGHTNSVQSIVFRGDGKRLASASFDHLAVVWDAERAREDRALPALGREDVLPWLPHARYSLDGSALATITQDGVATIRQETGATCTLPVRKVSGLAWDRAGELALFTSDAHAVSWFGGDCTPRGELEAGAEVDSIAFDDAGRLAVGVENSVSLWDLAARRVVAKFDGYPGFTLRLSFAADGRMIVVTYREGAPSAVVLQRLDDPAHHVTLATNTQPISEAIVDRITGQVVAASYDQHLWIFDPDTGAVVRKLEGTGPTRGVRASPDGSQLVALGGTSPTVWDAVSGARLGVMDGHTDRVRSGDFLDAGLFVTAGDDGEALVWDTSTYRPILDLGQAMTVDVAPGRALVLLRGEHGAREWRPVWAPTDPRELDALVPSR